MRIGLDLDGTLISCKEKHCSLMNSIAKALSINIDIDSYWLAKRNGKNNIEALVWQGIDGKNAEFLNKLWCYQIENIEWLYFDKVFEGAREFLDYLMRSNHSLHLISARNNANNGLQQIKHLNLERYFKIINFVQQNKGEKKEEIFRKLELEAYIGDTEHDHYSAIQAGVQIFLVDSGMRSKKFLQNSGLCSYSNLSSIIKEICND